MQLTRLEKLIVLQPYNQHINDKLILWLLSFDL